MEKQDVRIIILAAGQGTRMGGDLPKVLAKVKGISMIKRLLHSVDASEIDKHPIVIVGYKEELVKQELGDRYHFITQKLQLGTGHAVNSAKEFLKDKTENIIVLYGDQPFTSSETIRKMFEKHQQSKNYITLATVKVPNFDNWYFNFYNFSRIIRDEDGKMLKDVQFKDTTKEEKKIIELNPCYYCFKASWLWNKLEILKNDNAQKEYYLTDLIKMGIEEGVKMETIDIDPREALGANSKAELEILEIFAT